MPTVQEQFLQLIANSKKVTELPEALGFSNDDYIPVYNASTQKLVKVKKSNIVFSGEPITTITGLTDTPNSLIGQGSKILVVNEAQDAFEFKDLAAVQGVTSEIIATALGYTPANDSEVVKTVNNVAPDVDGNVNIEGLTAPTSQTGTLIDLSTATPNPYNYVTPLSATLYTYQNPSIGVYRPIKINAATEPKVTNSVSVTAGSFIAGKSYRITTVGTTDYTAIGAASNTVGVSFNATGVGSGTGTASLNATKISGSEFLSNINMEMIVDCMDGTNVRYFFLAI